MARRKTVVVFEQSEDFRLANAEGWGQRVLLYQGRTPDETREKIDQHYNEMAFLVVHAYWDEDRFIIPDLICYARRWFPGPILGLSRDPALIEMLGRAGCTHTCFVTGMKSSMRVLEEKICAILEID